jgi:hypothetical protein
VTVRAAARLVTMSNLGRISGKAARNYLRALALTEPGGSHGSYRSLRRIAERRSVFGKTGVFGAGRRRGTRVQVNEMPECLRSHPEFVP